MTYISEHCQICNAFAFCFTVDYNGFFMKTIDVCEKCLNDLDKRDDSDKMKKQTVCCRSHKPSKLVP